MGERTMSFQSWLQNFCSSRAPSTSKRKYRRQVPLRAATRRPTLEVLEVRSVLSTFTVANLADSGERSLRQAVIDANAHLGPDAIAFSDGLQGTIPLTSGLLRITDDLTIDGPGAELLAVSGNHQSRIFSIITGTTVAIAGLTMTEGRAIGARNLGEAGGDGGSILNIGGNLSLTGVVLSNNQSVSTPRAIARGGAIANLSGATLTVTDCLFTQNQARGGAGGGQGFGGGIINSASR